MSTHRELCERAGRWLRANGCGVVAVELATAAREQPDAIGWRYGRTVLVEVKTSVADFRADTAKPCRIAPDAGMGDYRLYFAPVGLLAPDDMPRGWGLLEWDGKRVLRTYNVPTSNTWGVAPFVGHKINEAMVLCSLVRRLEHPRTDRRKQLTPEARP